MDYLNSGFLVLLLIAVGSLCMKNLFGPYTQEKAKNLATKEDIEAITKRIESVKLEYSKLAEQIRGAVKVASDQVANMRDFQREAMLAFFDKALVLLFDKLQTRFGEMPVDGGKSLWEYQQATNQLFTDLYLAYHRLLVFSEPGASYLQAGAGLLMDSFLIANSFRAKFGAVKKALLQEDGAHGSNEPSNYRTAVEASNAAVRAFYDEIGPIRDKAMVSLSAYIKALNDYLRKEYHAVLPDLVAQVQSGPPGARS